METDKQSLFTFVKVEAGSYRARVLGMDDYFLEKFGVWACDPGDCPSCGHAMIYIQPLSKNIDLFAPENAQLLAHMIERAKMHEYHCGRCGSSWVNVEPGRRSNDALMALIRKGGL